MEERKRKGESREAGKRKRKHKSDEQEDSNPQLEEELRQRSYDAYLEAIKKNYTPLHPELHSLDSWKFVDSLQEALKIGTPEALRVILTEPQRIEENSGKGGDETTTSYRKLQGVFMFNMMDPEFCKLLIEEVAHFEEWCRTSGMHVKRPNTMNSYGAIVDHFGLGSVIQDLIAKCVEPFSRILYPHVHPADSDSGAVASLDSHHAFVVEYGKRKDTKLDVHVGIV